MKQRWYNVGRIGAISDGAFAIAMTLLVLEITLPELEKPVSRELFQQALLAQAPHVFSWLVNPRRSRPGIAQSNACLLVYRRSR